MAKKSNLKIVETKEGPKLDLGCGKAKREGFLGVDQYQIAGVDLVADLRKPWPWETDSIPEVHCSHFVEHLSGVERVHFFNELYRVLKPGAKAAIITPHWASNRAYGDYTHQWPPVSEMLFYYLSRDWRLSQAPHTDITLDPQGYDCDFDATWGYGMHQSLLARNQEYQGHALQFWKEAAQDTHATLTKKVTK